MQKLLKRIITFSLKNKAFTFFWVAILVLAGIISFLKMPIEAFPDVTNTQIVIVSQWNGRSAEEVERFVTIPIEIAMNSVQRKTSVRSTTMFGLSIVKIIFEDNVEDFFARQQVNNQLQNVKFPDNVETDVQPPYGPTGEIFRYVLKSKNRNTRDLLTIQNWVIDRQLRSVPGVADLQAFGGENKIYEVEVDPNKLATYDITPIEVYEAINKGNLDVGGDVIEKNGQAFVVKGIGMIKSLRDIENVIVCYDNGNPVLVKSIAKVQESAMPRVGQAGLDNNDDVVEGIVVMRKGENAREVLKGIKERIKELNSKILPSDVTIVSFYDRDKLMDFTTHTVMHNVLEGILLVTIIVFLFMANWRTTLIVSIIVPLSLLFAFLCLGMKGMSANLLSLGAVDFGIIIDGAVVMVEGLFVALNLLREKRGFDKFNKLAKAGLIKNQGSELGKAIFFSKMIIIMALLPIFSFEKVEGKMFSPLAWTLGFALLGALIFTLTLVPVLVHIFLNKNVYETQNKFVLFWNRVIEKTFLFSFSHKRWSLSIAILLLIISLFSFKFLGSEFMPQLNEGALWVEAKFPMSSSLNQTVKQVTLLRRELLQFQEVDGVLSQTGRSNDGTDPSGFYYVQMQVNLKPHSEWNDNITYNDLVEKIDSRMKNYQGVLFNYSQPIIDNVAEAVAGFNADNGVKIYGDDLQKLDALANEITRRISSVSGIKDLGVMRNLGQPEVTVELDKERMAVYGVTTSDAQTVLEMAFGGKTASVKFEGERKFDIRVRYDKEYRKDEVDIGNLLVPCQAGNKIPLKEICKIKKNTGPAFIYRDNTRRFIGVKFSIRDRDLGSTINEAQSKVADIKLPEGYSIIWTGEFENQVRATNRLVQVVPISIIAIFILLFIMFANIKDALLVIVNVPFALVGGIIALHIANINFGISAGVGFIALFGICIQNGVLLTSQFHKNIQNGLFLEQSILDAVKIRTRPVVMTALMASIGLMPAALSTGIGSETQKPLAVVIIGGLLTATLFTLVIFPIVFWIFNKNRVQKID